MKVINKLIEAIVTFNEKGIPSPVRIKIHNDADEESTVFKISKILYFEKFRDVNRNNFYIFGCRSVVENRVIDFELKFELTNCKWYLYKM